MDSTGNVRRLSKWLDGPTREATINGSQSQWTSVTRGAHQGFVLELLLFSTFISGIDKAIECTLSKFAGDTKLSVVVATPEEWDATQRDLDKLEKCANGNLMRFHKTKVLHLGQGNFWYQSRLGDEQMESSPAQKGLGVLVGERLSMTQLCTLAPQKAKRVPGCIKSSVASRARERILPLCSALVRSHLEYCAHLWGPQHRKHTDLLEQVERRPSRLLEGWSISSMGKD
ncbi:rna-directed dna polymerase from mobile element jockey-like [Willisornis vidua]|uniref:Rna-directed dna polymerase from mobile element jockey-like n=1 Tax=Willisornis vidua TaxID=1566151 RepID=A0ABQ9CSD5_9PASS|nr:rna-directed dna polymerase from mobile element jockey-like [Willisornis vidua]